jgi:small basic protein
VPDVVQEVLHVEPARIRRSDRPYAAISEGLAIEPALQHKLVNTQHKLDQDRRRFLSEQVGNLVTQHIQDAATKIADDIASELFDGKIKGTLQRFRKSGGKIADLKSEVAAQAQRFEPRIPVIVTAATDSIFKGLPVLVIQELQKWFEAAGLRIDRSMLNVTEDRVATANLRTSELPDLLQDFNRLIAGVLSAIVGVITASVCGGSGTALLMSGPIGWLIGLVLGAAVAYLATRYGMDAARARAEALPLPAWTVRLAMRESSVDSARGKLRAQVHEQVLAELDKLQSSLNEQIEETVNKEIEALTELHQL